MTFRYDTRHLSPQAQRIIAKRDEQDRLLREKEKKEKGKPVFSTSIFIRLGHDSKLGVDGPQTIIEHQEFCREHGSVWFSTNLLSTGMSKTRRTDFLEAIRAGMLVEVYLVSGRSGGGVNEISHLAEVVNLETGKVPMCSPDSTMTPDRWKHEMRTIWIELKDIKTCERLTTNDFCVISTGNTLADAIAHSQYSFGYVRRRG